MMVMASGCDIWRSGIDEVEKAEGPTWDVDLAIPLLPATEVELGEMLVEHFGLDPEQVDREIRLKSANILEEDRLTDEGRIRLMDQRLLLADQIDLTEAGFNYEKGYNLSRPGEDDGYSGDSFRMSEINRYLEELADDLTREELFIYPDGSQYKIREETLREPLDFVHDSYWLGENETISVELPELDLAEVLAGVEALQLVELEPDKLMVITEDDYDFEYEIGELPDQILRVQLKSGEFSFVVDGGGGENIEVKEVQVWLGGQELPGRFIRVGEEEHYYFNLADRYLTGDEKIKVYYEIRVDRTGLEEPGLLELRFGITEEFKPGLVELVPGAVEVEPLETVIELDFDGNLEHIKEFIFRDGLLEIEIIEELLNLGYELEVFLDGKKLSQLNDPGGKSSDSQEFELAAAGGARVIPIDGVRDEIPVIVEIELNSFQYIAREDVEVGIELGLSELDWAVRIVDYPLEEIRLYDDELDFENIDELIFTEDSRLLLEILEFPCCQYTVALELPGRDLVTNPILLTESRPAAEVFLSDTEIGSQLDSSAVLKGLFNGVVDNSSDFLEIELRTEIEIEKVRFDPAEPEVYQERFEIELASLPAEISSIEITRGIMELEILAAEPDDLKFNQFELIFSDGRSREFSYDSGQGLYYLDLAGEVLAKTGGSWGGLELVVDAEMTEISVGEDDVMLRSGFRETTGRNDLDIGRITFEDDALSWSYQANLLSETDFKYLADVEYFVFDQAVLEIEIEDIGWEIDHRIGVSVGGQKIAGSQSGRIYRFNLADRKLKLTRSGAGETNGSTKENKAGLEFVVEIYYAVDSLEYDAELAEASLDIDDVLVRASLDDLSWSEIRLNLARIAENYDLLTDTRPFATGFDRHNEILKDVRLNYGSADFMLYLDNNSAIDFELTGLELTGLDSQGNKMAEVVVDLKIPARANDYDIFSAELRDKFFELIETYPAEIRLAGGELLVPDQSVSLRPDDSIYLDGDYEIGLSFILRPENGLAGDFVYYAEPSKIKVNDDVRSLVTDNIVEFQFAQLLSYDLPLNGTLGIYIDQFDPGLETVSDFYDSARYRTDFVELPARSLDGQRFNTAPGDSLELIKLLADDRANADDYYIGFKVSIPAENEITFRTDQRFNLKMWLNLIVRVQG